MPGRSESAFLTGFLNQVSDKYAEDIKEYRDLKKQASASRAAGKLSQISSAQKEQGKLKVAREAAMFHYDARNTDELASLASSIYTDKAEREVQTKRYKEELTKAGTPEAQLEWLNKHFQDGKDIDPNDTKFSRHYVDVGDAPVHPFISLFDSGVRNNKHKATNTRTKEASEVLQKRDEGVAEAAKKGFIPFPKGTLAVDTKKPTKATRAGYYRNTVTGDEAQATLVDGVIRLEDKRTGEPMQRTADWEPVSLSEGVGQGRHPSTQKVTPSQVAQYAPQVKQMLEGTKYELRSGRTGELAMVDATLQAWNDLTFQQRMSGTDASNYLHELLQETKEGKPDWGRFEKEALFYNDFNVPAFRGVISEKLDSLRGVTPPTSIRPLTRDEEIITHSSGRKFIVNHKTKAVEWLNQ